MVNEYLLPGTPPVLRTSSTGGGCSSNDLCS